MTTDLPARSRFGEGRLKLVAFSNGAKLTNAFEYSLFRECNNAGQDSYFID